MNQIVTQIARSSMPVVAEGARKGAEAIVTMAVVYGGIAATALVGFGGYKAIQATRRLLTRSAAPATKIEPAMADAPFEERVAA